MWVRLSVSYIPLHSVGRTLFNKNSMVEKAGCLEGEIET